MKIGVGMTFKLISKLASLYNHKEIFSGQGGMNYCMDITDTKISLILKKVNYPIILIICLM